MVHTVLWSIFSSLCHFRLHNSYGKWCLSLNCVYYSAKGNIQHFLRNTVHGKNVSKSRKDEARGKVLLNLSHIQQICCRRLSNYTCIGKNEERFYKLKVQPFKYRWKLYGKRRKCSLGAISPFNTMFSIVVRCIGVRKRMYVGKG